ncbi:FecR domain-containing protein [Deinococcus sp. YIM 134068]|uniref:FecR domain-containing protein n=1 Tax=Deinococcus lichenicola TaxID=3118910 RepID=UPI002F94E9A0
MAVWMGVCVLLAGGVTRAAPPSSQGGAPLRVQYLTGRAELLGEGNVWRAASGTPTVALGLRVGTGRARVASTGGKYAGSVLLASASRLGVLRDEANLLEGNFLLEGPVAVHVRGKHLVMDRAGRARVDLRGDVTRRVAVTSGSLRVALGGRAVTVGEGQQLDLASGSVSAFREEDPWYAAQFTGVGEATVQALRGTVRVTRGAEIRPAAVRDRLNPGERLTTGEGSWAEVEFTGGGYLRLQSHSELSVTGAEGTGRGREVTLQLSRGSAWNVVPGSPGTPGGLQLSTPVVSTAARGTVFRVDAGGRVKVLDEAVAGPSQSTAADAEAPRPLTLTLDPVRGRVRDLTLSARSLPDARVTATVAGRRLSLTREGDRFRLGRLDPPLPEGTYTVRVSAQRRGEAATRWQTVVIDRTPPALSALRAERVGRSLTVTGTVRDDGPVTLTTRLGDQTFTRRVQGNFRWLLPAPGTPPRIVARDEAGNESYANLP